MTADGRLCVAQIGVCDLADLHLTAFVDNPRVGTVYLAELQEEPRRSLAARWGIIKRAVADWQELAAEESVDVAHLCGPLRDRPTAAGAFLAAGKSVILDAPPAASLEDLDAIVAAARHSRGRVFASLPHLMHPAVRKALEVVKQGDLGRLFLGQVTALAPPSSPPPSAFLATGFHAISVLQRFLGPAISALAECQGPPEHADSCALSLRHPQDALSSVLVSQVAAGVRPLAERRLVGSEGLLLIRDDPEDELPLVGFRGEEVIPLPVRQPLHVQPWYVGRTLDHFVDCLLDAREPEVTVAEARAVLATALAAREAARSGQRVRV